jgi:hypothetical protein
MVFPRKNNNALLGQLERDDRMPSGAAFHAAGPTMVGWRVMEAWEFQEAFDAFYHEGLESALRKRGEKIPKPSTGRCTARLCPKNPELPRTSLRNNPPSIRSGT